jgi:hypothetical protein
MAFEKGHGPHGLPRREKSFTEMLEDELERTRGGKSNKQALAEKLIDLALGGDIQAIIYIFDRLDGKPRETVEMRLVLPNSKKNTA